VCDRGHTYCIMRRSDPLYQSLPKILLVGECNMLHKCKTFISKKGGLLMKVLEMKKMKMLRA